MIRETLARSWGAGALALVIGILALAIPPNPFGERATWETLLEPYGTGALVLDGFRVEEIRRGPDNGIVVSVRRPADGAAVEVLVVERGRWRSVQASRSFTIDYEIPRSPAAERAAITALLADAIRSHDHGLPAPDAVPLREDDTSVLPWWLEMLRGARGLLLGVSLVLLGLLVLLRAPGLAGGGVALAAVDVIARLAGVPLLRPDVGAVWIVPAAVAWSFVGLRPRSFRPLASLVPVLTVAAIALVLRLGLGPWGPLHVNGHGARFVGGVVHDAGDIAAYGPGYREIFAPVAALAPASPDWAIFALNALLSALVPPLAFAIGRMTGLAPRAAVVAALLLAIDPVAIRMGATEVYFVPIAFLCAAASAVMLAALRALEASDRWRAAALLGAAGLLLSLGARIHPSGWVAMATVPFVVLAGDAGTWPRRVLLAIVAAVVAGGILLATSSAALLDVLGNIRTGTVYKPPLPPLAPLVTVAVVVAVYALLVPRRWLALPAGIAVVAMLLTSHAFAATWIWQQAYERIYLTLPVVAAVAVVPSGWLRRDWLAAPLAIGLGLVWVGIGWPIVTDRTTDHLEYRWVRDELREIPLECRIVHLAFAGEHALLLPTYVPVSRQAVAMDARQPRTIESALAPGPCLYYVHSSLCSTPEGRPECEAIERRLTLVPVARASFPPGREFDAPVHEGDSVETVIARVEGVLEPDDR